MSEYELRLTGDKARTLRELRRARARVQQLERELRGEPRMPEVAPEIPEFLTLLSRTASRRVTKPDSGGFERPAPENQFSGDAAGILDPTSPQF